MAEFTPAAYMFHMGKRFICSCGCSEFRVEVGTEPIRFWCDCGTYYTEYTVGALYEEHKETADSGE